MSWSLCRRVWNATVHHASRGGSWSCSVRYQERGRRKWGMSQWQHVSHPLPCLSRPPCAPITATVSPLPSLSVLLLFWESTQNCSCSMTFFPPFPHPRSLPSLNPPISLSLSLMPSGFSCFVFFCLHPLSVFHSMSGHARVIKVEEWWGGGLMWS